MKQGARLTIGILSAALLAGGSGYWLGQRGAGASGEGGAVGDAVLSADSAPAAGKERKILFYRNPMGLSDTSPTPKKDPMGMDYIAVYDGEADTESGSTSANQVKISTEKVQKLGVKTEIAQLRTLEKTVRATGRVEADERRTYAISPRFEGYVERLHVNVTGQSVGKGQALFEMYSPELVSAQREYATALEGATSLKDTESRADSAQIGMQQLAQASLQRLKNWDISDEQLRALTKSGQAKRTLTFRSPVTGIVTEKKAVQGMRFMPGDALYQVTDLSAVWVIADVFEQDIGQIKAGDVAKIRINAYPEKGFEGKVSYVYPTLNAATRTVPVRVELANPGLLLKPAMFAQVDLPVSAKERVLAVPVSAVIDSGTRQIVIVQKDEGRFEPRAVKLGARSDSHIEILDGVQEGEPVVIAANFLIDAESNLKAAISGFGEFDEPKEPALETAAASKDVSHHGEGTVTELDTKAGSVSLSHGPIESLKWPAMTMEFNLANPALLKDLPVGGTISFEFVERQPGEWVITRAQPLGQESAATKPHTGH